MKLFNCSNCANPVYFENSVCVACGYPLGFDRLENAFHALTTAASGGYQKVPSTHQGEAVYLCANHGYGVCNWLTESGPGSLCAACSLNKTIPDLEFNPGAMESWRQIENAKHRLVYALNRLRLPFISKAVDSFSGLYFEFLADDPQSAEPVRTGHKDGVITLNINEADPVQREQSRTTFGEPYRTLVGHFRHEIGHYYWNCLVLSNPQQLESFRLLFGDERADYGAALEWYYANTPAPNWQSSFVTAYASAHPWEDWAETWAHYLHLVDVLETAYAFGLTLNPRLADSDGMRMSADFDPYTEPDFDRIANASLPMVYAVNSINRSMGQPDLYPFVLPPAVLDKLRYVHLLIRGVG